MNGWLDGWMEDGGWIYRQKHGWMGLWMDVWMDRWRKINDFINGSMVQSMVHHHFSFHFVLTQKAFFTMTQSFQTGFMWFSYLFHTDSCGFSNHMNQSDPFYNLKNIYKLINKCVMWEFLLLPPRLIPQSGNLEGIITWPCLHSPLQGVEAKSVSYPGDQSHPPILSELSTPPLPFPDQSIHSWVKSEPKWADFKQCQTQLWQTLL